MAITDVDPRAVQKGQVKTSVDAGAATLPLAAGTVVAPPGAVLPSRRDGQLRQAARARQAVVVRWLRELGTSRP